MYAPACALFRFIFLGSKKNSKTTEKNAFIEILCALFWGGGGVQGCKAELTYFENIGIFIVFILAIVCAQ